MGFLLYTGMVAILVMWPGLYQLIFISMYMYLKAYIQNLFKMAQWLLRKANFNFTICKWPWANVIK